MNMQTDLGTARVHLAHAPGSPLAAVITSAHRIGASGANAVVIGESGTGKETLARLIHATGIAPESRFVVVTCGGRGEEVLHAELFGGPEGAAAVAAARGGTLYLEDVGELPLAIQARLVRHAVDGARDDAGALRVVASTTRDLLPDVNAGRFRRDLYDALSCPLRVPPLRDRRPDVEEVFERCWAEIGQGRDLTSGAREVLRQYAWPGNVRELDACARRLGASAPGAVVSARDVERQILAAATGIAEWALGFDPPAPRAASGGLLSDVPELLRGAVDPGLPGDPGAPIDLPAVLRRVESGLISWALERTHGNKAAAAALLCIRRTTLVEKIRRLRGPDELHAPVALPARAAAAGAAN
jgi:DNA-binding NtrC family response regulator